jgi:very-short-patch-repair endonuclease
VLGFKFRRQEAIAGFFVDFYCPALRLAIELDGGDHRAPEGQARDAERDAALARRGLRVVHLLNREVSPESLGRIVRVRAAELTFPLSRMGEGDRG